jgi:hypothetical protein
MVGDAGDLQKVATIDNNMTNGYLVKYNTTTNRLEGVNPNTYVTPTYSGNITATGFIKSGGTSSQFLKADGTVDNNFYIPASRLVGWM